MSNEPKNEGILITFVTGTVELGRGTGRWLVGADGWWREQMTDTLVRDDAGNIVKRTPCDAVIAFSQHPYAQWEPEARPWWKFW